MNKRIYHTVIFSLILAKRFSLIPLTLIISSIELNGPLVFLYSIIDKITSDDEEKKKDALRTYIGIPLIKSYLDKKEKKAKHD